MALATPGQLARIFDLDLWRAGQPGLDEQFDADRFGVWLEVLVESGATVAAQKLAGMDVDLVIAGFAQHVARLSIPRRYALCDDGWRRDAAAFAPLDDGLGCDVGGYLVVARRTDSWDAIVAVLTVPRRGASRLLPSCDARMPERSRTPGPRSMDWTTCFDDGEQVMFDLAFDRERRREKQGYVTPAQARAFLQMSRQLQARARHHAARQSGRARVFPGHRRDDSGGRPQRIPAFCRRHQARRLLRGTPPSGRRGRRGTPRGRYPRTAASRVARADRRVAPPRLGRIQTHMQFVRRPRPAAYSTRSEELAYLANTIMAGCSIQARPFTAQEASDAAVAVCNLGLENWPPHWLPAKDATFLVVEAERRCPTTFSSVTTSSACSRSGGRSFMSVCMYAAEQLIGRPDSSAV